MSKYKIILFNHSKNLMMEIGVSKYFILASICILFSVNFIVLHFFSSAYASWQSSRQIENYKDHNTLLVDKIQNSEDKILNIEEKMSTIIDHDNHMRNLLSLPKIHEDVRKLGIGGPDGSKSLTLTQLEYLLPNESDIDLQDYFNKLDFIEHTLNTGYNNVELLSNGQVLHTDNDIRILYPIYLDNKRLYLCK